MHELRTSTDSMPLKHCTIVSLDHHANNSKLRLHAIKMAEIKYKLYCRYIYSIPFLIVPF